MAPNEKLSAWLRDREMKAAEFARRIEYDRSNFHHILKGRLRPTIALAHKIEQETDGAVPMSAWAEAA